MELPTHLRFIQSRLDGAIREATSRKEYQDLAGTDDECAYMELLKVLDHASTRIRNLRDHRHEWTTTEDDSRNYCRICGRSGDV